MEMGVAVPAGRGRRIGAVAALGVVLGAAGWATAILLRPAPVVPPEPSGVDSLLDAATVVALAGEVDGPATERLAFWRGLADPGRRPVVALDGVPRELVLGGWHPGVSVRTAVVRGTRISVRVTPATNDSVGRTVLLDLFAIPLHARAAADAPGHEAAGRFAGGRISLPATWEWVASFDGTVHVTIGRPPGVEPLRVILNAQRGPAYLFPVAGADPGDVWSDFGDWRDGGRRVHHGIDIFAPRGTPALAAVDGLVARVGTRDRGGNIVTVYDEVNDIVLYYAHLDEAFVSYGQRVAAGQPIGTVGNTGNAVTTPPHLHLGLYAGRWSRPINPWYYFVAPD